MDVVEGAEPPEEWVTAANQLTWDLGYAIQDSVIRHGGEGGFVHTNWRCLACGYNEVLTPMPPKCPECGKRATKASEYRVRSGVSNIGGGLDCAFAEGGPLLRPVEIKSVMKDAFMGLTGPVPSHEWRTKLYLRLISEDAQSSKRLASDEAIILYVCKGGYAKDPELNKWPIPDKFSPFREFRVRADPGKFDEVTADARSVFTFRLGETPMPPRVVCSGSSVKRALACSVKNQCFSGELDGVYLDVEGDDE